MCGERHEEKDLVESGVERRAKMEMRGSLFGGRRME